MILKPTDKMFCPCCYETLEFAADDYCVPGITGIRSLSEETCPECDKGFSVERLPDGTIDVEPS